MTAPSTIGHYIVERELGRGAMGVVYLAADTKLGRKVAIKALPMELALDPMRQGRFDREARTLAAVNHPNIGAIYGIEESQGARYLVLELVDGETLAERLAYATPSADASGVGVLEVADALNIARQVAAGMAAAHEQGIIHRDLKPANVKIRTDGLVKVLDFGIARGGPVETALQPAADAPTIVGPGDAATTHVGTIIGTPGYMSPEQARGRPVGKGTDLWSFGCMIFECLTGRVAFPGETMADALAATLTKEPSYERLPAGTPLRVVELLKRCLEKDQRRRLSEFGEARAELERAIAEMASPTLAGVSPGTIALPPPPPDELEGWPGPAGNLPGDDTSLIGRTGELADLTRLLLSARHVGVSGPPGIGKTRLAISAARAAEGAFACGAWHVDAGPSGDTTLLAHRLLLTLDAAPEPGETPRAALSRIVGRRRVLLLIDNCQFDAPPRSLAELVDGLLDACPRATIVTIGREPLGATREQVYRVPALSTSPDTPAREGAAALLRERARVAKATLDATPASAPAMAALCRKLQGIPLAIELAAAWAESALFDDVNQRIDEWLAGAGVAALDAQPPEQVVRLMVDWASQALTEGERGMLRRLSVFAGACTLRAAAAISGAADSFPDPASADPAGGPITQQEARVLDILGRLGNLSLVSVRRSADGAATSTRFILHEPVRLLSRARLLEFAGSTSVIKRHVQYFTALGDQGVPRLSGPDAALWRARLGAEVANFQGAIEGAESTGDTEAAARLGAHLTAVLASSRPS